MDLHAIVKFLKGAVDRSANGVMGCYSVADGTIYARDTSMTAGAVWDDPDIAFNVPAAEIEGALGRMKGSPAVSFGDGVMIIKQGRLKATMKCLVGEAPRAPDLRNLPWMDVPKGFYEALSIAIKFCSKDESNWTSSIRLMDSRVSAISNHSGIDIEIDDLDVAPACLMTRTTAEYVVSHSEDPAAQFAATENAFWMRWEDGRWLRAQLMQSEFPPKVEEIFNAAGMLAPIAITDEWREALADVIALADKSILIDPDGMTCVKDDRESTVEIITPLQGSGGFFWRVQTLEIIAPLATHWNPDSAPKPSLFVGPNFRGVLIAAKQ